MNIETGELKLLPDLTEEMLKRGEWLKIPEKFNEEANKLIENGEAVNFYDDTPLSKWAAQHRKYNNKSRRKMANTSKKINRRKN